MIAAATLDRILHHSTTVNIKGGSYRLLSGKRAGIPTPSLSLLSRREPEEQTGRQYQEEMGVKAKE